MFTDRIFQLNYFRLQYFDVTDVTIILNAGSFFPNIAIFTFKLSFRAAVHQMRSQAIVTLKGILVTAINNTLVKDFLVVCKMSSCIKIFESCVTADTLAVKQGAMEIVLSRSLDSCTLEFCSAGGTRSISCQPAVNAPCAVVFLT